MIDISLLDSMAFYDANENSNIEALCPSIQHTIQVTEKVRV